MYALKFSLIAVLSCIAMIGAAIPVGNRAPTEAVVRRQSGLEGRSTEIQGETPFRTSPLVGRTFGLIFGLKRKLLGLETNAVSDHSDALTNDAADEEGSG